MQCILSFHEALFIHCKVLCVPQVRYFVWLGSIPLYEYVTVYSFVQPVDSIRVVVSSSILSIKPL